MDPASNFDSNIPTVSADDRTLSQEIGDDGEEYGEGDMFETRFFGDNMDSLLGSDYSEDGMVTGINWNGEHMTPASTPVSGDSTPNTPDTVGDVPNGIKTPLTEACTTPSFDPVGDAVGTTDQIGFDLGTFPTNHDMENLYPKVSKRRFGIMARDLHLVVNHHIKSITGLDTVVMPRALSSTPDTLLRTQCIPQALDAVITQISSVRDIFANHMVPKEGELQGTRSPPTTPWQTWPPNDHFVYLSKLLGMYTGRLAVRIEQSEITDYCIVSHVLMDPRELLFDDGCKVQVSRSQMCSMEVGRVCDPAVVSAWGRIRDQRRKDSALLTTACLDVVEKLEPEVGNHSMVEHWEEWIKTAQIDIHNSELVFIPIKMKHHYALIVFSFNDDYIHTVVPRSPSDDGCWTLFADKVITQVHKLLHRIKHKRCENLNQFTYQLIPTAWRTKDDSPDSGIELMHLMDVYDGNPSSMDHYRLSEEEVRVALKIAYVADIVKNSVSVCRDLTLARLPGFILAKTNSVQQPTREDVKYRRVGRWLANVE